MNMHAALPARTAKLVERPSQLFIDGAFIDARSGETFDVYEPSSGDVFAQAAAGGAADIDQAVAAARRSFDRGTWRGLAPAERARIMWRVGELIDQHAEELAELDCLNIGTPLAGAAHQVAFTAESFRYYAGWCTKIHGKTTDIAGPNPVFGYTLREPVGVVGHIVPWNAPLLLAAWKIAPALAAGCSNILKPAEQTPLSAVRLAAIMHEAGIPAGVMNVVTGLGSVAGAALAEHMDVDKISFTGSTDTGRRIIQAASLNMKRVTLELGGKSPFLIFDDANIDKAIGAAGMAIFGNSGQICSAGSRLYVQRKSFDRVVEGVAAIAGSIKLGRGLDPDTQMGPLISEKQFDRVMSYLDIGRDQGAEVVCGGARHGNRGYFVQPTILAKGSPDIRTRREEIFGPVLSVSAFDEVDEAVALANDTNYGLASYLWTNDIHKARDVASRIRAGTVWTNTALTIDNAMPSGGMKQSGWGREGGAEGLEPYLETKSVVMQS
jgi:phenylacetaldehyde dehydrogenase